MRLTRLSQSSLIFAVMLAGAACSKEATSQPQSSGAKAVTSGQIADFAAQFVAIAPQAVASLQTQTFTSLLKQMAPSGLAEVSLAGARLNLQALTLQAASNAKSLDLMYPNIGTFLSRNGADLTKLNESDIQAYVGELPKLTNTSGLALADTDGADSDGTDSNGSSSVDEGALNHSLANAVDVEATTHPAHPKRCVASKVGIGLGTAASLVGGGVALATNIMGRATLITNVISGVVGVAGLAGGGVSGYGTFASCTGG